MIFDDKVEMEEQPAYAEAEWALTDADAVVEPEQQLIQISRCRRDEIMTQRRRQCILENQHRRKTEQRAQRAGWTSDLANMRGAADPDPEPADMPDLAVPLHPSHQIRYAGGIWFCRVCGGTHSGKASKQGRLPEACMKRPPSGVSRSRLRKLEQGMIPATHADWPDSRGGRERREVRTTRPRRAACDLIRGMMN